ncbi:hypothetical protein ACIA8I_27710 [Streptomyces rishiriensis]|uniref:hypothetical protein n=1 Tax=Streptomyces rishiriensis TaxID=68264 RepID=UPI0037A12053
MTLATLTRSTTALPSRADAPGLRQVGPGWEVLLMPEPLARLVTRALAGRPVKVAALGWVFAHAGQWGIFLPEMSDDPAWPPGTTYLAAGGSVTLPPFSRRSAEDAWGWVRLDGSPLSRPLLLHPVVTALAADLPPHVSPVLESRP